MLELLSQLNEGVFKLYDMTVTLQPTNTGVIAKTAELTLEVSMFMSEEIYQVDVDKILK